MAGWCAGRLRGPIASGQLCVWPAICRRCRLLRSCAGRRAALAARPTEAEDIVADYFALCSRWQAPLALLRGQLGAARVLTARA